MVLELQQLFNFNLPRYFKFSQLQQSTTNLEKAFLF